MDKEELEKKKKELLEKFQNTYTKKEKKNYIDKFIMVIFFIFVAILIYKNIDKIFEIKWVWTIFWWIVWIFSWITSHPIIWLFVIIWILSMFFWNED